MIMAPGTGDRESHKGFGHDINLIVRKQPVQPGHPSGEAVKNHPQVRRANGRFIPRFLGMQARIFEEITG